MAEAVIGKSYLQVIPKMDMGSLKSQFEIASRDLSSSMSSAKGGFAGISSGAASAFGMVTKAAGAAAIGASAAIGAIGKQALDAYASYEQLAGGIEKLYGNASSIVEQNAQRAYQTAGMSANQYMEQVSSFSAALTSSLGGDTVKAAKQADVAMRAISDNVNTFGSDITSVTDAYQGFAKQNYTIELMSAA